MFRCEQIYLKNLKVLRFKKWNVFYGIIGPNDGPNWSHDISRILLPLDVCVCQ